MECRREHPGNFFQKKVSRYEEEYENHTLYTRWKKNKIRNCNLTSTKVEIPTVSAENIARNTFQQTVRTANNSRNDNNWSKLPKEDGSAVKTL